MSYLGTGYARVYGKAAAGERANQHATRCCPC
jgi:hypothetical protein